MSTDGAAASTDLIRWTFVVPMAEAEAVEAHLADLGAEVFVRGGDHFQVFWEETAADLDAAVEAIWNLAGVHFEITQEEFHRLELHILHPEEVDDLDEHHDEAATELHPEVESLEAKEL